MKKIKTIILKEMLKIIIKEIKTQIKHYLPITINIIKKYLTLIISIIALLISISTAYKLVSYQVQMNKEIVKLKEICEPLQKKINKFNDTYLEEIK